MIYRETVLQSSREQIEAIIQDILEECPPKFGTDLSNFVLSYEDGNSPKFEISKSPEKGYILGIRSGSISFLFDFAKMIASDNLIFPGRGKCTNPIRLPTFNYVLEHLNSNALYTDIQIFESQINVTFDRERAGLQVYLFQMSLVFIVMHEYFHLYNGHLDFLLIHRNSRIVSEEKILDIDLFREKQTLELDADRSAIWLFYEMHDITFIRPITIFDNQKMGYTEEEKVYHVLFIAFLSVRCFFGKDPQSLNEIVQATHPPPLFRFEYMAKCLTELLIHRKSSIAPEVTKIAIQVATDFDGLLSRNIDEDMRLYSTMLLADSGYVDYQNSVLREWNRLRTILVQYAYGDISPQITFH